MEKVIIRQIIADEVSKKESILYFKIFFFCAKIMFWENGNKKQKMLKKFKISIA